MVRDYELMYIARPDLDEEGLQGAVDSVEQMVNGTGGSVVKSTSWGRRRLAYEVDHLRDGHYMLLHLRLDSARVAEVERALAIHETVFRHLLVIREAGDEPEAGADAEVAAPEGAAAPRQAPVAVAADDEGDESDDDDEADDEDDGDTAAVAADDEEDS